MRPPSSRNWSPEVELVELDVTDAASIARAISCVIERAGRIDILEFAAHNAYAEEGAG